MVRLCLAKESSALTARAGPFGDVGVTTDLDEAVKYLARASVDELERFSETP
jgi:hypothetical protein